MNLNEDEKTTYWIAKGLAVIAIVACHCCHVSENASALNQISYKFMNLWMGLGVPVFYFFAGYFMNTRIGWRDFWKKKSITIILPWIFTGSMVCIAFFRIGRDAIYHKIGGWLFGYNGHDLYFCMD